MSHSETAAGPQVFTALSSEKSTLPLRRADAAQAFLETSNE
jgi:hypothetical protein